MPGQSSHLPTCTYRVQLHKDFGFDQAAGIVDYLADLGVSHLYTSPYLQACPGSMHGYDTVDHSHPGDELGGKEGHARMVAALQEHGLGHVLDIVPNHMGIGGPDNAWWWDVLQNGQASPFATYFDIDWVAPEVRLHDKILLPILADHYGRVLEAGQLRVERHEGEFRLRYHDTILPLTFCSLGDILRAAARGAGSEELGFIADTMESLPQRNVRQPTEGGRCARDRDVLQKQLSRLAAEDPRLAQAIDQAMREVNDDPDTLDALLSRQHYRLAYWRTAAHELNYRRFFDINQMVGLRAERESVFAATHTLILQWVKAGIVQGLRVDHPDGLCDPQEYFGRLSAAAPEAWIVAEKILQPGERLCESWPIDGTTGYEFVNRVNGLFVHPAGERPLTEFYRDFTGQATSFAEMARYKKHQILRMSFGGEVNRLAHIFLEVCEQHRQHRDYARTELQEALREAIACFPVYRTYIRPERMGEPAIDDVRYVQQALDAAHKNRPDIDPRLLKFLSDILLLRVQGDTESELVLRFQQLTGPVMAKAIEDTAFYCYNRLVSLNEVGGNPGQFGLSLAAFHRACMRTVEDWPTTMNATSTHDTKRSEDVRARINLLSGIPAAWTAAVTRWSRMNERFRKDDMPDRNMEYLLYQTLVGAWPLEADRAVAYMLKAAREAKTLTSWTDPNRAYEEVLRSFVSAVLRHSAFVEDLAIFVQPLVTLGQINSLSQTLIKLTAPGVPDIYQGCELWDLSLVDPDNRRPIDYQQRRCLLGQLDQLSIEQIVARADEGLPKLWLTRQALRLRQRRADLFATGDYRAIEAQGEKADCVIAFSRQNEVVTIAPRLIVAIDGEWGDTNLTLPPGTWRNVLTGETAGAGTALVMGLLARFPTALLEREAR